MKLLSGGGSVTFTPGPYYINGRHIGPSPRVVMRKRRYCMCGARMRFGGFALNCWPYRRDRGVIVRVPRRKRVNNARMHR